MKKLIICLIILISNVINAQHCGYDGAAIIVLKVHTLENQNTISNLKITLVKKIKNKIVDGKEYSLTQTNNFPFLTDEYSVIISRNLDLENYYLKIESLCEYEDNTWTYYGTTEVKLSKNDKFSLCGNYDLDNYYTGSEERIYKPIEVILSKRNCEKNK